MFRQLGRFARLATCLFAIAIVMGSCGEPIDEMMPPTPPPPVELTPMEKLAGSYELVEHESDTPENVAISGDMYLKPGGSSWEIRVNLEDEATGTDQGPAWSANATTITFTNTRGPDSVVEYTLEGKFLAITPIKASTETLKWRKID